MQRRHPSSRRWASKDELRQDQYKVLLLSRCRQKKTQTKQTTKTKNNQKQKRNQKQTNNHTQQNKKGSVISWSVPTPVSSSRFKVVQYTVHPLTKLSHKKVFAWRKWIKVVKGASQNIETALKGCCFGFRLGMLPAQQIKSWQPHCLHHRTD